MTRNTVLVALAASLLSISASALVAAPAHAQSYTLVDLGPLAGPTSTTASSSAHAISTLGDVVGESINAAARRVPTLWPGGNGSAPQALSTLIGYEATCQSINNVGQAAGYAAARAFNGGGFYYHATLWTNGVIKDLGVLSGGSNSFASSLNDAGQVVGHSEMKLDRTTTGYVAVLWQGGKIIQLPTLGGRRGSARAVSSDGRIVGESELSDRATTRAFLFTPTTTNGTSGTMTSLGTLGGAYSDAYGINAFGEVVGTAQTATGESRAFIWRAGQGMVRLDEALGATCIQSRAQAINGSGVVVGNWIPSWQPNGEGCAFVYANGVMTDLNAPGIVSGAEGWRLVEACGVSANGRIVGWGRVNGVQRAFHLVPVP